MARMRKNAVAFSSYITQDLKNIMEFLIEREEITKVVFIRKAVRYFLSGDRIIDKRVMRTKLHIKKCSYNQLH